MRINIKSIDTNDDIFSKPQYIQDRLLFNYIEGARKNNSAKFFSDSKSIIICKKDGNNSVWIWTDDDVCNNRDAVISIANVIYDFKTPNLQFFMKPNIASIFSDIYALLSHELNYRVKEEFSLGVYKFSQKKLSYNDEIAVLKYSKKYTDELYAFYKSFQDDFHWDDEKLNNIVNKYKTLNTFLLMKNGELISVCVLCDDDGDYSSIRSVVTKHEHRNKGYGAIIANVACTKSEKGGKEKIMLYANNGNKSAISAFKKAGFEQTGEIVLINS